MHTLNFSFASKPRLNTRLRIDDAAIVNQVSCRVVAVRIPSDEKAHAAHRLAIQSKSSNVYPVAGVQREHRAALWSSPQNGRSARILSKHRKVRDARNRKWSRYEISSF